MSTPNSLRKLLEDPFGPYADHRILNPEWPRKGGSAPVVLTSVHMKCGGRYIGLDETEFLKEAPSSSRITQHAVETFGVLEIEKLDWLSDTGKKWIAQDLRKRDDDFKMIGRPSRMTLESVYGDGVNSGSTISVWLKFDKILSAAYMTLDEDPTALVLQAADRGRAFCVKTLDVELQKLSRNFLDRYRMRRLIHQLIDGSDTPIQDRDIDWLIKQYYAQVVAMDKHFRIIYNPSVPNPRCNKRGDLRLDKPRHTRVIHNSQIREMFARQAEWLLADQIASLSPNARYLNIQRLYEFIQDVRTARRAARKYNLRWGEPWNEELFGNWAVEHHVDWTKFGGTQEDWKRLLLNARKNPAPRHHARSQSKPTQTPWLPPATLPQISVHEPLTHTQEIQKSYLPPTLPADFQYDSDFSEASTDPETASDSEINPKHDTKLARQIPWYYSVKPTLESTQHTWRCPSCNSYQIDLLNPTEEELEELPDHYADLLRFRKWTAVTDPDLVTAFGYLVNTHYKEHLTETGIHILANGEKGTSVKKVVKGVKGKARMPRSTTSSTPVASSSRSTKPSKGPLPNPTPYQLRSLVMDYLCHQCYTRTAIAFAKDGTIRHLDADGDEIVQPKEEGIFAGRDALELSKETLREAELRNDIRVKILSGKVDDAIELINEHFPSVLGPSTPNAKPHPSSSSLGVMESSKHLIPTTTDPRHLLLNLRILGFTELCRTKPLIYSSPSLRINEIDMSESEHANLDSGVNLHHDITRTQDVDLEMNDSMDTDADVDGMGNDSDTQDYQDFTCPTTGESNGDSKVESMILQGQKLYALLDQIDHPAEKDLYKKELVNVGALLAYPEPETSPLARYLSMERREAVAEQINKAILTRIGQSPTSNIEVVARYTTVLWALANELKIKARPGATVPPVQQSPRPPTPPLPAKQGPEGDQRQVVPPFNLQTFLDLR